MADVFPRNNGPCSCCGQDKYLTSISSECEHHLLAPFALCSSHTELRGACCGNCMFTEVWNSCTWFNMQLHEDYRCPTHIGRPPVPPHKYVNAPVMGVKTVVTKEDWEFASWEQKHAYSEAIQLGKEDEPDVHYLSLRRGR